MNLSNSAMPDFALYNPVFSPPQLPLPLLNVIQASYAQPHSAVENAKAPSAHKEIPNIIGKELSKWEYLTIPKIRNVYLHNRNLHLKNWAV